MADHNTPGGVCIRCGAALRDAPGFTLVNCTVCGFVCRMPDEPTSPWMDFRADTLTHGQLLKVWSLAYCVGSDGIVDHEAMTMAAIAAEPNLHTDEKVAKAMAFCARYLNARAKEGK